MRFIDWFFRRRSDVSLQCHHCDGRVAPCVRCRGAWRGAACDCGIGRMCDGCGRHWV